MAGILPLLLGFLTGLGVEPRPPLASLLAPEGQRKEREANTDTVFRLCNRNQVNCPHTLRLALNPHKHFVRQEILNPIHRREKGGSGWREAAQSLTVNIEWGLEPSREGVSVPPNPLQP